MIDCWRQIHVYLVLVIFVARLSSLTLSTLWQGWSFATYFYLIILKCPNWLYRIQHRQRQKWVLPACTKVVWKNVAFPTKRLKRAFARCGRAIRDAYTSGMVRICIDTKSYKILGASIVRIGAGNIICEIKLVMKKGAWLEKLSAVIHPYPTTASAIRVAEMVVVNKSMGKLRLVQPFDRPCVE